MSSQSAKTVTSSVAPGNIQETTEELVWNEDTIDYRGQLHLVTLFDIIVDS